MPAGANYTPGDRFGALLFVERIPVKGKRQGVFDCDCGSRVVLSMKIIALGKNSCGCQPGDPTGRRWVPKAIPFDSPEALKKIWRGIIARCENPKRKAYADYGARGIKVCDQWKIFENFLTDVGARPSPNHSLDHQNNDGNYEPGNVRWATRSEQQNNMRRNILIEFNGVARTFTQWGAELGIDRNVIESRIRNGWTTEKALTTPVRPKMPKGSGDVQARYRAKKRAERLAAA